MAAFCLTKNQIESFKQAVRDGRILPEKLMEMTSEERNKLFTDVVGKDNALQVNSLFESKMLLKNQQQGFYSWGNKVAGLSKVAKRDLISRIERMDKFLNPEEEKQFLSDLAKTKLGIGVTREEAQNIYNLSQKIQDARTSVESSIENNTEGSKAQIEMGSRIWDLEQYLQKLNPKAGGYLLNLAGAPRAAVASLDFVSAPYRHGFFAMSHPAWIKNYANMPRLLMSEKAFRARMGKIYGSKYYDALTRSGLHIFKVGGDLSKQEETFASNILDKFPITRASKRGYTGFLNGLRMDIAVKMMKSAEMMGADVSANSKAVKSIAEAVNNITGAASLSNKMFNAEPATPLINLGIFSARMQVARFNMLNPVTYLNPRTSMQARMMMARSLIGSTAIATTAILLAQAGGLKVGTNINKTDFGEIHIGNISIDTTGGNRVLATLISRIISGKYVSSTGKVTQLGVGTYKPLTRMDLVNSFIQGKLAPGAASVVADFLTQANGLNPYGEPVTLSNEIKKQLIPLNITNGMDIFASDPSNTALGVVLGLFGIPVNSPTASSTQKEDWTISTSKEMTQFKSTFGVQETKQASNEFNTQYSAWQKQMTTNKDYNSLSPVDQSKADTKAKDQIKQGIFDNYGFTPDNTPSDQQIETNDTINGLMPNQ